MTDKNDYIPTEAESAERVRAAWRELRDARRAQRRDRHDRDAHAKRVAADAVRRRKDIGDVARARLELADRLRDERDACGWVQKNEADARECRVALADAETALRAAGDGDRDALQAAGDAGIRLCVALRDLEHRERMLSKRRGLRRDAERALRAAEGK